MTGHIDVLSEYLNDLGVAALPALTVPFDPGYDPVTVAAHLEQSHRFMAELKLSMATWMIADTASTSAKVQAARKWDVPTVVGGGPFEIASARGLLDRYLDVCAETGIDRIEAAAGFTDVRPDPQETVAAADARGLGVQFELGRKHGGPMTPGTIATSIDEAQAWLDAGASSIVIEARESAENVGVFDAEGTLQTALADRLAGELGLQNVIFEAPDKRSQFALISHFGPHVRLGNVRLEEVLRVEIYRRGLHSDAFGDERLAPADQAPDEERR